MEPRLTLIEQYNWTTRDTIILCDAFAVAGDATSFFPPLMPIGWTVSAVAGTISYGITANEYYQGNVTQNDMLAAHLNWIIGFAPYIGVAPAAFQFKLDMWGR